MQSHLLFEYIVEDNIYHEDDTVTVQGRFTQRGGISQQLQKRLLKKGARQSELAPFLQD